MCDDHYSIIPRERKAFRGTQGLLLLNGISYGNIELKVWISNYIY